jgi:hypothetical protein
MWTGSEREALAWTIASMKMNVVITEDHSMIRFVACSALALGVCVSTAAFARDSSRYVCSGFADLGSPADDKMGISIDFYDSRAPGGNGRKFVLSSIYQGKLFQGSLINKDENDQGKVALKNGRRQLFVGSFKIDKAQDDSYTMSLDGKINNDPGSSKTLQPAKAKLPCVDLSL